MHSRYYYEALMEEKEQEQQSITEKLDALVSDVREARTVAIDAIVGGHCSCCKVDLILRQHETNCPVKAILDIKIL